ncbi:MAG: hypothetical protein PHV36_00610 [Elusimicrobiales bacterium]|nr:hypothetical protein [Elusimicrobiales bacterium]
MRLLLLTLLFISPGMTPAQDKVEKRLTGVEKRVAKVEKRVTRLEGAAAQPAAPAPQKEPATPIAVYFKGKKQVVGKSKLGIKLFLEFENLTARRLYAFNGNLIFKNEAGAVIWTRPYAHSEQLGPGETVEVSMGILSDQAKEYLKFVKARSVSVSLEKQEAYGSE